VFVDDAVAWQRTGSETSLLYMLRAAESGVPHDIGAAYAILASRTGNLLEAMEAGRLALAPDERDAALLFVRNARRVRALLRHRAHGVACGTRGADRPSDLSERRSSEMLISPRRA